ncbi:MAG: ComEA family DNA-binding protein [Anaeroplasma sp.]
MYKKREILIIILIIFLTIFLAFLPQFTKSSNVVEIKNETEDSMINVEVKGELMVPGDGINEDLIQNNISLQMPIGSSYGEIIISIEAYLTAYSIIDDDFKKRYFEDTIIIIDSSYIYEEDNPVYEIDKIKISTASQSELMSLYGIGKARAKKIIDYRLKKEIESFEELKAILGVSDAIINAIKEKAIL